MTTITVQPRTGTYNAALVVDTHGENVNVIDLHLRFNPRSFSIQAVNNGGSMINLWIAPPAFSNDAGTLDLTGLIPGGEMTTSGLLLHLTIVPHAPGSVPHFDLATSTVLLNDGAGTKTKLSLANSTTPVAAALPASSSTIDTEPPDPFVPKVGNDPRLLDGNYFVAFAATDQHSGVDHYDVLEVPAGMDAAASGRWVSAMSPYRLNDQMLTSDIYVRAVDGAGNFRVAEVSAPHPPSGISRAFHTNFLLRASLGVLLIGTAIVLFKIWKGARRS